jgi:Transcriptional regulator
MDIKQLKYFLVIAEEQQITSAANRLNMSQPPLSQQLKQLENELGVPLFKRNTKKMELTEEGKILQQRAKTLTENFDSTLKIFKELRNGTMGSLYIGYTSSVGIGFLPKSIKHFQMKYKDVDVKIYEGNMNAIQDLMDKGTIELGIIREPFDHNMYHYLYIDSNGINNEEDFLVTIALPEWYSSASHEITFSELREKPLIFHRYYEDFINASCSKLNFVPKTICTNENFITSLYWVINGLGIAIMPNSTAQVAVSLFKENNLVIKGLKDPLYTSNSALVWLKDHYLSAVAHKYLESIKELN